MNVHSVMGVAEVFFIGYMAVMSAVYLFLNLMSFSALNRYMQRVRPDAGLAAFDQVAPPVSLLVPAYNEAETINSSVRSLLQLTYPEFEIVVINDGSADSTLAELASEFALRPSLTPPREDIASKPILGAYESAIYPNLRVIDKENGGKADSLNVGINLASFPYLCAVDADSILQRDSLQRVMRAFLNDPRTVAAGGTIRLANGCEVQDGFLRKVNLPGSLLATFQIVEYLRAFLFGRLGWDPMNALLIISGAFGVFRRDAMMAIGGYRTDTVGEDMDVVMRMHRHFQQQEVDYRISFVPDPICWTEAPEEFGVLGKQRARWQRGLGECLLRNWRLAFNRRGGAAGWLAYPFMLCFELLSPAVEVVGYISMSIAWYHGIVSTEAMAAFLLLAIGLGILLSVSALLLEEASFHLYNSPRQMVTLVGAAILENFGFRQMVSAMRLYGLVSWMFRREGRWGEMTRKGNWQSGASEQEKISDRSYALGTERRARGQLRPRSRLAVLLRGGWRFAGLLLIAAVLTAMAFAYFRVPDLTDVRVLSSSGDVRISASTDGRLDLGSMPVIETGADGLVSIGIDGGGALHIAPNSLVRVLEVEREPGGRVLRSILQIDRGEIERNVPKDTGVRQDARIITSGTQIGVRGTDLSVVVGEGLGMSVATGKVAIANGGRDLDIEAGFGIQVTDSGLQEPVELPPPPSIIEPMVGEAVTTANMRVSWDPGPEPAALSLVELRRPDQGGVIVARAETADAFLDFSAPPADGNFSFTVRGIAGTLRGMPSETVEFSYHGHHAMLSRFLLGTGEFPSEAMDAAIAGFPDSVDLRLDAARALRRIGDAPAARLQVEEALRVQSDNPGARAMLGWLALDAGELQLAADAFTALAIDDASEAEYGLGVLDMMQGKFILAHDRLARAQAQSPGRADIALSAARAALALNNRRTAIRHVRQLLEQQPENPDALRMLDEIRRLN